MIYSDAQSWIEGITVALAIALAAGAAFLSALAVVLQRVALESAPATSSLSPRLLLHALRKRGWFAGFGLLLGTFVLQAAALRVGQLSVVQPVLTTELVFLVAILVVGFQRTIGWRELAGILAIVAGLAGFFASASPAAGTGRPDGGSWLVLSAATVAGAVILVAAGRVGPRWWRAAALGAATAVLFSYNAAVTKTLTSVLRHGGWTAVFTSWYPYLIIVCGASGLFILQGALHAGPIAASRTASVILNPLISIAIGVSAFGEVLRSGVVFVSADVVALAVLCAGVVVLVRSPLIAATGVQAESEYLVAAAAAAPPG
jgi:drug/metabolite transporter (DMT)-like permease